MTDPEIIVKITDGEMWVIARFSQEYQPLFETNRFKEEVFIKLVRARLNKTDQILEIVIFLFYYIMFW